VRVRQIRGLHHLLPVRDGRCAGVPYLGRFVLQQRLA
jgi:hypothetical protein